MTSTLLYPIWPKPIDGFFASSGAISAVKKSHKWSFIEKFFRPFLFSILFKCCCFSLPELTWSISSCEISSNRLFSSLFHADLPICHDIFRHRRSICRRTEQFKKNDESNCEKKIQWMKKNGSYPNWATKF